MGKGTILVVDDEEDIQELVRLNLVREGYEVITTGAAEDALELARSKPLALIVLDLMLPGMDGLEACKLLKADSRTKHIPIVILSAKSAESDITVGLEIGADDYVTKPFSSKVLIARIRRILRHKVEQDAAESPIRIGSLTIDPARRELTIDGKPVPLTFSEFNILHALAKNPGVVFTRYQIVDAIHGADYIVSERAIDVQIAYLRKKLGPFKAHIETVRGVGYKLRQ